MRFGRFHITRAMALRAAADAALVQAGLAGAYVVRFVLAALEKPVTPLVEVSRRFATSYVQASVPLGVVCVVVFFLNGFYTDGRLYRGRYRYPWIVQAVGVAYACFGGYAFMVQNWFDAPRGVILLGFGLTALLVVASRVASSVWASVLRREGRLNKRRLPNEIRVETVLVIGGAGYIGSALLRLLLQRGYRVRLLDLLLFGNEPVKDCIGHPNLEIIQADFRQIDRIVEATRGVDAVIHLGGLVGDPACAVDEPLTIDINLIATRFIAEVARGEGVQRFVFASTCSVYGSGDHLLNERSTLSPLSLYAKTKLASEKVLEAMAGPDFAPVILRFGTIYGFSGRTRFDLVVNLLTAKAVREGRITVFGGDQWRPFVHVQDAARAVFHALQAPLNVVNGEVFNVGSNEQNYTIQQIGEKIAELVPSAEVVSMGSDTDRRNYRVNFSKIREVLGYRPSWTLEMGIEQVKAALESGVIADHTDARYSNLKALTEEHASKLFRPEQDWPRLLLDPSPAKTGETAAQEASEGASSPTAAPALSS